MITWKDILSLTENGNPAPDNKIRKTDREWRRQLTEEQYRVTRQGGTETAFSSEMCSRFEPGMYACVCCQTELFDAGEKFESGSGWPSFTQPTRENAISYHGDSTHNMHRVETRCNTCQAHLGHVFPDGPEPSGLRYCMNAAALQKIEAVRETAIFGGGCFWCTEAVFKQVRGVVSVESGYSGGHVENPSYTSVCNGTTGHAEVVQVVFDPGQLTYSELLRIHLSTHDPTTLNQQGADRGTQYRSIILTTSDVQQKTARNVIQEMQGAFDRDIVTEITPFEKFYGAEAYHQDYYSNHSKAVYCQMVINPKLGKFRALFKDKLKT